MLSEKDLSSIVVSRKGFTTFLLISLVAFSGFVIASAFINVFIREQESMPLYLSIFGILGLIIPVWTIPIALTLKIVVSKQELHTSSIWGERHLDWKAVEEIRIWPTFFDRYWVQLPRNDGRRIVTLSTYIFANHHEVVKAIVEAAHLSNPKIPLNMWAKEIYGKPPYGIFSKKESA